MQVYANGCISENETLVTADQAVPFVLSTNTLK